MRRARAARPTLATDWYKDAVIYQLHVKSFYDANGDGVGDFEGLIAKLDYIAGLGVDTLWLLPFYPSPRRDDGYDIAEYQAVHPDYGTLADVRRFIAEAHARGLRIITELVINHTSDQHAWFQRARQAKRGSAARDFYVWSDTDQAYDGTRIIFCDTEKSNWTWDPVAGQFFWHRFYSHQPDLNFDNPRVLEAVLSVMRFWLDLGVDGLRLDAVPYLIEREGTNNENLPETHTVLKKIRAAMDAEYPDRLLLAEANQWPEDTQAYFGDGDECHMAFHFPLMPRMYMAIAREDRFPISDIMRQTPDIPETCQWALFLRNHDELTLEMVTDEERDYLWQTYAPDHRARINLGIRRRLAPLLERDRRRIELMTSLLLTMPGTPVIYYGDEIGMGDNVHLGDRDGVRTPMQWSIDRNGGFSMADPARLVLPTIMDPVFGFQAVNVEAQQRDNHSLLNWTRRILAVRQRHGTFGRGTLRFLYPRNRKVLAYLREDENETLLCVANLSRTMQAVELDLCEFEGAVPVELSGGVTFPPIGRLNYLLTLPAYGFCAFQLVDNGQLPEWHVPLPEPMPDYQTLVMRDRADLQSLLQQQREAIESILPDYLKRRRWFAVDPGAQPVIRIRREFAMPSAGPDDAVVLEIEVEAGGASASYLLPLTVVWQNGTAVPVLAEQLAIARVRHKARMGYLTDAFAVESFARGAVAAMRNGHVAPSVDGDARLEFRATSLLADEPIGEDASVRWLDVEQSNSSLVMAEHAVLKLLRRPPSGISAEVEIGHYLSANGYANTPAVLGEMICHDSDGDASVWAVLTRFVRNLGDAWRWTGDHLRRLADDLGRLDESSPSGLDEYDQFAQRLGVRLGELHEVMSRPTDDAAFSPVRVDESLARTWQDGILADVRQALDMVAGQSRVEGADSEAIASLVGQRDALEVRVAELSARARGSLATRIHGDFHLGQVLVLPDDAYLLDFEGEPERPLEHRRAKHSPIRDVAGLLRSIDYACQMALREALEPSVGPTSREDAIEAFRSRASSAFLGGYTSVLERARQPWVDIGSLPDLIDLFLIEKAAYEISYEAMHRPTWIGIPVRGLLRALEPPRDEGS